MSEASSWERIRAVYAEQPLALVLGAGISQASGIPTWQELLETIAQGASVDPLVARQMRDEGYSLPSIAAVLEEACGGRERLLALLRQALYGYACEGAGAAPRSAFELGRRNPTLRAIAAFCVARAPGCGEDFEPSPGVAAVATTNIDCVLQDFVAERYGAALLRTIERASASPRARSTPIYPLHGTLRLDAGRAPEAPDRVVITEQDFFDVFDAPTSYSTYTMLHLLREHPACFLGQSMTDENIRRLLHYSWKERAAALAHEPRASDEALLRHFAILRKPLPPVIDGLARLGVRVLAIDAYDEIPARLASLYEVRPDARWSDVFP